MPPFASEQFHAITSADPERVWNTLTATGVPLDCLHGMTADTDWQPGARLTMTLTAAAGHAVSPCIYAALRLARTSASAALREPP